MILDCSFENVHPPAHKAGFF